MNNSQAIIDKILGDAKKIANSNTKVAEEKAAEILEKAESQAREIESKTTKEKKQAAADCLQRRVTVAGIDAKKILLEAKTQVINCALANACEKIACMDKKPYLQFIESILMHGAEDGDTVVISKGDKDKITQEFVDSIAKKLKIKLTLSKEFGDFVGGIYIKSSGFDKNYTVQAEVNEIREQLIGDLAKILFKE